MYNKSTKGRFNKPIGQWQGHCYFIFLQYLIGRFFLKLYPAFKLLDSIEEEIDKREKKFFSRIFSLQESKFLQRENKVTSV
jgi:hypothetical protein